MAIDAKTDIVEEEYESKHNLEKFKKAWKRTKREWVTTIDPKTSVAHFFTA